MSSTGAYAMIDGNRVFAGPFEIGTWMGVTGGKIAFSYVSFSYKPVTKYFDSVKELETWVDKEIMETYGRDV